MAMLRRNRVVAKGSGTPPTEAFDHFFLVEIESQAAYGEASFGELLNHISEGSRDKMLLCFSQMLLVFAANTAKILFPPRTAREARRERAKRLREALKVVEDSPVRSQVARNYVEHFDERIERYLEIERKNGVVTHRLVVDERPEKIELDDGRVLQLRPLQLLNVSTLELTLYDETIALRPIAEELRTIRSRANTLMREVEAGNGKETV